MLAPTAIVQEQAPAAAGAGVWSTLQWLWQTPGVLETCLVVGVVIGTIWFVARVRRFVDEAARRHDVADYLLGAEQALHGDAKGAAKRLVATLAKDPSNHHARLLYARALVDLGQPEAAHKQHLTLEAAFGVASAANKAAMGRALLAAGEPLAAANALTAATGAAPRRRELWEELAQALLQSGDAAAATTALQRSAALAVRDTDGAATRRRLGTVAAHAGLAARDRGALQAFAALATAHGGDTPMVARVQGRLNEAKAIDAIAAPSPWRCGACGIEAATRALVCAVCGAAGSARLAEPGLIAPIDDVAKALAAISASPRHVRGLVEALLRGEPQAGHELVRLGADAVAGLCDAFGDEPAAADARLHDCLCAIGEPAIDGLLAAFTATPWFERLAFGLLARATNRRIRAAAALAAIGGGKAKAALEALAAAEDDARLREVVQDALRRCERDMGGRR